MDLKEAVAKAFRMDEEARRRYANPWSVWTRFAALPAAIWSRTWIGWWCLVPTAAVVVWLFVNPSADRFGRLWERVEQRDRATTG